jgi:hypothetical protein
MPIVTPGTFTPAALATEISTDPIAMGYAAAAGNPADVALLLNQVPEPAGVTGGQEQIYKGYLPVEDAAAAVVAAEYTALSAANKALWTDLVMRAGPKGIKSGDANMRTTVAGIFGGATTSRANLIAISSRLCSRAEAKWGEGFRVTDQQVATALGQV